MSIADKLTIIAENEKSVFDAGKKKQYDEFWDVYQSKGNRMDYSQAFRGVGWRGTTFKPKYPMIVTNGSYFLYASGVAADPIDMIALEEQGLIIDFSQCTKIEAAFSQAPCLVTVGTVDLSGMSGKVNSLFSSSRNLRAIKLLRVHEEITDYPSVFKNCDNLTDIEIDGIISADISFSESPLSTASIISIVEHLSKTTEAKSLVLKRTAVESMDFSDTDYEDWNALINTKKNWSISLG